MATRKLTTGAVVPGNTWVDLVDEEIEGAWRHTINHLTDVGGTGVAYTANTIPPFAADTLVFGIVVVLVPDDDCGDGPTLNIDGIGAFPLKKSSGSSDGAPLDAGDLVRHNNYVFEFRDTYFMLLTSPGASYSMVSQADFDALRTNYNITVTDGPVSFLGTISPTLTELLVGQHFSLRLPVACGDDPTITVPEQANPVILFKSDGVTRFKAGELRGDVRYSFEKGGAIDGISYVNWQGGDNQRENYSIATTGGPVSYTGIITPTFPFDELLVAQHFSLRLAVDCGDDPVITVPEIATPIVLYKSDGVTRFVAGELRGGVRYSFERGGAADGLQFVNWQGGEAAAGETTLAWRHVAGRPGDTPDAFSASLADGDIERRPPLESPVIGVGIDGAALRVTGAGNVVNRAIVSILPNHIYRLEAMVRRVVNPLDPSNDSVVIKVACYNSGKGRISGADITIESLDDLTTANGLTIVAATLALTGTPNFLLPESCDYVLAWIEYFGTTQQTDIIVLDLHDVSDARAGIDTDVAALESRVAELEDDDADSRLTAVEASLTGSTIARFRYQNDAVTGDILPTTEVIGVNDRAVAGDEAGGWYYKTASGGTVVPGHTNAFQKDGMWFEILSRTITLNTVGKVVKDEIKERIDELLLKGGGCLKIQAGSTHIVAGTSSIVIAPPAGVGKQLEIDYGPASSLKAAAGFAYPILNFYFASSPWTTDLVFNEPNHDASAGDSSGAGNACTGCSITGARRVIIYRDRSYGGTEPSPSINLNADAGWTPIDTIDFRSVDPNGPSGWPDAYVYATGGSDLGVTDDGFSARVTGGRVVRCNGVLVAKRHLRYAALEDVDSFECRTLGGAMEGDPPSQPGRVFDVVGGVYDRTSHNGFDLRGCKGKIEGVRIRDIGRTYGGTIISNPVAVKFNGASDYEMLGPIIEQIEWAADPTPIAVMIASATFNSTAYVGGNIKGDGGIIRNYPYGIVEGVSPAVTPSNLDGLLFDTVTTPHYTPNAATEKLYRIKGTSGVKRSRGSTIYELTSQQFRATTSGTLFSAVGSLAANTQSSNIAITVTGAASGDNVLITPVSSAGMAAYVNYVARATANTVTVQWFNTHTSAAFDFTAVSYAMEVWRS